MESLKIAHFILSAKSIGSTSSGIIGLIFFITMFKQTHYINFSPKMSSKLFYSKAAKGIVSLAAIIILLSSILATGIYYNDNITADVIRETSLETKSAAITITEANDIKELIQLNEGWYEIKNSYKVT